ncbi:MAG TPA: M17 family peptidase N-terminal domain-containing protein, partial [Solirubrobacteraceae bacterium]|nr:M17 family peptidase N-terminal domain-containing protein [Solirubrobacteraceae bacterium]
MTRSPNKLIPAEFTPVPSLSAADAVEVVAVDELGAGALDAIGVLVHSDGDLPEGVPLDREALARAGFEAKAGTSIVLARPEPTLIVIVGMGPAGELTDAAVRDAAAAFVRAVPKASNVGLRVPSLGGVDAESAARALAEGALLARYRYEALKSEPR